MVFAKDVTTFFSEISVCKKTNSEIQCPQCRYKNEMPSFSDETAPMFVILFCLLIHTLYASFIQTGPFPGLSFVGFLWSVNNQLFFLSF